MRLCALVATVLVMVGLATSCKKAGGNSTADETPAPRASHSAQTGGEPPGPGDQPPAAHRGHDPANPPIDCPLRKQGINPHDLKPFDKVEEYIAFLERPDRAAWQRPDAVVEALSLAGTETVADVGAGSGYFTFRIASALPGGRVRAIDIEPEMIRHIHHKAMTTNVSNVEAVLATPDDPKVTQDADLVFICDVLHHVQQRQTWLKRLHSEMRPGAKLVLIEFKEGKLPEGPPESVKIPKREVVALTQKAGFRLTAERPKILPYQYLLVFSRP